jgi:glycosyltransferase involved in cell wall biosynthesis
MKFIALIPFKNEERFLPTCLSSIENIVDEIICIDDGSTDRSREIAESYGCKVYKNDQLQDYGWAEHHIRQSLLRLGRESGGTHFLCLDADEALTYQCGITCRFAASMLKPGQNLRMQWLALWKSPYHFRHDRSVWSNNFKDFIFADDGICSYNYEFMHVARTPARDGDITLNPDMGAVLHYQFVDWDSFNIKQADYRCSELINVPYNSIGINQKYSITFERDDVFLQEIPEEWLINIKQPDFDSPYTDWRRDRITSFFKQKGPEFFESLNIWHIESLSEEFRSMTGRYPRSLA